jgi:hypothetical protein
MKELVDIFNALLVSPFSDAELAASATVLARGNGNPLIFTQGTIAYLFTFDSGYTLLWLDSGGPPTPYLQATMAPLKTTNLAIVGYNVQAEPRFQVPVTMQLVELFSPDVFLPCHHEELLGGAPGRGLTVVLPDMATEPLFTAIRDALPNTQSISPLYRAPVCVNIRNGKVQNTACA